MPGLRKEYVTLKVRIMKLNVQNREVYQTWGYTKNQAGFRLFRVLTISTSYNNVNVLQYSEFT